MVQAWQRQFGVDDIPFSVDRMTGTIRLTSPHRIDVGKIRRGAKDAGFSLYQIRIHTAGIVEKEGGKKVEKNKLFLKLPGSGQTFELRGKNLDQYVGKKFSVHGEITGWKQNSRPKIKILSIQLTSGGGEDSGNSN